MRSMEKKENAERYLIVLRNDAPATVWAEDYTDLLAELKQSGINPDDVIQITVLDF